MLRAPRRPLAEAGASIGGGPPGFEVYEPPPWLPTFLGLPWLERALDTARLRAVRRRLVARGCDTIVLYVWRPEFAPALDRVDHDACLYHVVDEYSFSPVEHPIPPEERTLLERVDRVLVHSPGLMEKKGHVNPETRQIPNGVDYEAVAAERPEPADLAPIPRPRVGYCGWLKRQLDWELVDTLAARHGTWSFVFVGGMAPHAELEQTLDALSRRPNVKLLGAKASEELLAYPAHFDACVMPYRMDDYTKYIYPLKLHEYLASGRPVVARPIRTLQAFDGVIGLADDADAWSAELEQALAPEARTPEREAARRRVARAHDWNRIAYRVAVEIAAIAGGRASARLSELDVPESWRSDRFGAQIS